MFRNILVATDGSKTALRGVEGAAKLSANLKARLTVVTVEVPYSYSNIADYRPESCEQYNERVKAESAAALEGARIAAEGQEAAPELLVAEGVSPAETIIRTASDRGCDLIVMASHGRRGIQALMLGSVTKKVLLGSKIPVLVY